jgi:hypothetical protein
VLVLLVVCYLFDHPLRPTLFPPNYHRYGKKKITGDEVNARAKANGYKRGTNREEDSRRDRNKHKDDTKKDQDGALDRYI